ncbi:MAG TPA: hypothetical protein VGZ22_10605 [Isosphaeraceae bacterium]|nr:hypothetical protein [Isosphaeraceae bacterium]
MDVVSHPSVVKVSRTGEVYWDGALVAAEELVTQLKQVNERQSGIVYYRESPEREPTREQFATFQAIIAQGVTVQLGLDAPSEWGVLEWFEVQECPHEFRFAGVPGQPVLFACRPDPEADVQTWLLRREGRDAEIEGIYRSVDLLISSNRVLETEPRKPDDVFQEAAMQMPSVHLRIGYEGKKWQACFDSADLPTNLQSFYDGCREFGLKELAARPGREIPGEQALAMVRPGRGSDGGGLTMVPWAVGLAILVVMGIAAGALYLWH